jgi:hypothetical protein
MATRNQSAAAKKAWATMRGRRGAGKAGAFEGKRGAGMLKQLHPRGGGPSKGPGFTKKGKRRKR